MTCKLLVNYYDITISMISYDDLLIIIESLLLFV